MEKPFRTIDEQIDILRSRGMVIDNIEAAQKALESISYYRLSGYSYPFRQYDKESRTRSDQFSPKTNLEQVLALYRFDERLRTTTFQELSRIEVGLRALIGYTLGKDHPYLHLASLRSGTNSQRVQPYSRATRQGKQEVPNQQGRRAESSGGRESAASRQGHQERLGDYVEVLGREAHGHPGRHCRRAKRPRPLLHRTVNLDPLEVLAPLSEGSCQRS